MNIEAKLTKLSKELEVLVSRNILFPDFWGSKDWNIHVFDDILSREDDYKDILAGSPLLLEIFNRRTQLLFMVHNRTEFQNEEIRKLSLQHDEDQQMMLEAGELAFG